MTREDLKSYRFNQDWIKGRIEYIVEYKTYITNITSTLSDMPYGSKKVQDTTAEKLATLIDNINDLLKRIVEEQEKQKKIMEQLEKVEQPYKLILEKAYIQRESLVKIAVEMGYSYREICRKNGIALKKFEEV